MTDVWRSKSVLNHFIRSGIERRINKKAQVFYEGDDHREIVLKRE